jgi:putative transposase
MARLPRLTVPGYAHHVIQRGNNRQTIFHDARDYELLLELLKEQAARHHVAIHSYVVMGNHFHLLATPATAGGIPAMMRAVDQRYAQYFNKRHGRVGALWEGRYRSTIVQSERYLLACMVYIDLNPVRAGTVTRAADYRWSSHGHYAGLNIDRLVTPHPLYWELGNTPFARDAAYIELVNQGVARDQQQALTEATLKGWALGDVDFIVQMQKKTHRRLSRRFAGRPKSTN